MLKLNLQSNQKNTDFIWNELLYSLSIKNYQLNKNHTTSLGISQFIKESKRFNYIDEEDTNKKINSNSPKIFETNNIPQINENESPIRPDDYRDKIARHILNNYFYNKVNEIIKGTIQQKFKRFPQDILNQISRKKNKYFLEITLNEFYEIRALYKKNKEKKTFEHNLSIINELRKDSYKEFREKSGFDDILEMTFRDLVGDYLKSKEYDEYINTLKGKDKQYYTYFAEHFIEHYDN